MHRVLTQYPEEGIRKVLQRLVAQVDRLIEEVSRWIGNDVRPLQFTEADLASGRDDPILGDVLSEGTVAGSRVWLSQQLRRQGA